MLKNFHIKMFGYKNLFVLNDYVTLMIECESLPPNVMYFYFIFITVKIACITFLLRIFNNNFDVILYLQKHTFHSSKTAAFTVSVFTNHTVLFVTFSVPTGFFPYMKLTVHIRMVQHTARTSPTEALIVKTIPDLLVLPVYF